MVLPEGKRADMVTIADVAKHAGVAVSTVSYVLSGKRAISATTRQRVLASIGELGYHPHAGARALASRRANVIAMVLPLRTGMHLPVLMRLVTAVVTAARRAEHDVLLMTADEGPAGLRRIAASALVDGVLVMDVEMSDARVPVLRELGRPSVLIGFPADPTGLTCVDLDFHLAGARCAEHLAGQGHTRIALLGAPPVVYQRDTGFAHRTRAGFLDAAQRLRIAATARPCGESPDDARAAVGQLLADDPGITGLVVHNEAALAHVVAVLPERIPVVAIGPERAAVSARPPLAAAVPIPAEELGRQAVSLLMGKLAGTPVPQSTLLAPEILFGAAAHADG